MKKWCEIRDAGSKGNTKRFEILNEELKALGLETQFQSIECDKSEIEAVVQNACSEFDQIRFSGETSLWALPVLTHVPASTASLKAADALVRDEKSWWPRNFLVDGLNRTLASENANFDISSSVFILGATATARAVVASLSKIGFSRMLVADPDDAKCATFVEELSRVYFGIQFQAIARSQVTQLPGTCSVAVNTITDGSDSANTNELAYFNFLRTGGVWLDLSVFPQNQSLQTEAVTVGATTLSGAHVLACTDSLWVKSVFDLDLSVDRFASRLGEP